MYLFRGLLMLQNRGYDSAGICTLAKQTNEYLVHKYASLTKELSTFTEFEESHRDNTIGIAHTRWATHGAKTDANSHPHLDNTNRFSVVHNGIIENYYDLRSELEQENGIVFNSDTDTEIIPNLISIYYDECNDIEQAIRMTTNRLEGTWAIVVLCTFDPDNLYGTRHGQPLLVGFGGGFMMYSSEQSGFSDYVTNYVDLKDDDLAVLRKVNDRIVFDKQNNYNKRDVTIRDAKLTPEPYPHWTIKEITEQYESSIRAINMGARLLNTNEVRFGGLAQNQELLQDINHLILLGCGTSYFAGAHSVGVFKDISGFDTVQIFDGADFSYNDIPYNGTTGLVFLSQSGETKDLHRCLEIARDYNVVTIGVVNVVDSMIARETHCGVYLNAGREVGVASTKSFTSQVIVLSMIAVWFSQIRDIHDMKRLEYVSGLRQLAQDIKRTTSNCHEECKNVAKLLVDKNSCFLLGKGRSEAIAKEASLKLKEIGYIHAEGYSSAALKHGTFALLDETVPVFFINPTNEHTTKVQNCISEVALRESPMIGIIDSDNNTSREYTHTIRVEHNRLFSGVLSVIPFQLIAYELALVKGHNPDRPKNLAKVVTVE
jgi:glucosamine--fructose-6-phosphate aminotransferase (isomerizing)